MAPSTTSMSISTFLMSHGTLLVLEPRRQTNADLKSANEVLVSSNTTPNFIFYLPDITLINPYMFVFELRQCRIIKLSLYQCSYGNEHLGKPTYKTAVSNKKHLFQWLSILLQYIYRLSKKVLQTVVLVFVWSFKKVPLAFLLLNREALFDFVIFHENKIIQVSVVNHNNGVSFRSVSLRFNVRQYKNTKELVGYGQSLFPMHLTG